MSIRAEWLAAAQVYLQGRFDIEIDQRNRSWSNKDAATRQICIYETSEDSEYESSGEIIHNYQFDVTVRMDATSDSLDGFRNFVNQVDTALIECFDVRRNVNRNDNNAYFDLQRNSINYDSSEDLKYDGATMSYTLRFRDERGTAHV